MESTNNKNLVPHDGVTEWSVCGECGRKIDWSDDLLVGDQDDSICPYCGSTDTGYL